MSLARPVLPFLLLSLALLSFTLLPLLGALPASEAAEEWIDLLGDRTLASWEGDPAHWRFEDGVLIGEGIDGGPLPATIFLFHSLIAADFILEAELRLTGGNSGIQYRSERAPNGSARGYQADLDAENRYSGILYEAGGRAILGRRGGVTHADDSGGVLVETFDDAEAAARAHTPGEWTEYRVIAIADFVRHEIGGIPTCEVIDRAPEARRKGRFAIQLHQGGPMRIEVRSLRVRLLGDAPIATTGRADASPPAPLTTSLPALPAHGITGTAPAQWIWRSGEPGENETCLLGGRFRAPKEIRRVRGLATGDNRFVLTLTCGDEPGTRVERRWQGHDWQAPVALETGPLPARELELRAQVTNDAGPAGFALRLELEYDDGTKGRIVTDGRWSAAETDGWGPIRSFGALGVAPWGAVLQERVAAPCDDWTLPPGFTAELLHSAAPGEGSWAALTVEGPNRVIVSPQVGPLLRVILPDAAGGEVRTEPVADAEIGDAQGLCFAHDSLYVHVTRRPEQGGGLWRLQDRDGDGFFEEKRQLGSFGVRNEHGVHAIALGPDGWLYLAIGNHVVMPDTLFTASPYRDYEEDFLLPRLEDPNGHATGIRAPAGLIVRVNADGSRWERVMGGIRNAYDLAFHLEGELFTYDADMEWDLGAPWYRTPRVLHVTSGAEVGWRSGTGKWPDGLLDAVAPVVETDLSSPTGVASGLAGSYPGRWGSALYIGDWAYGRILAVHLEEDGATWRGTTEPFCQGTPLNVTDLEFGPDGALYLTTGGRRTQSGLYRIRVSDPALAATDGPGSGPTAKGSEARRTRRALEEGHDGGTALDRELLWEGLGSTDRAVRGAARIAAEARLDGWRDDFRARLDAAIDLPHRRLEVGLALARVGSDADRAWVATSLAERMGSWHAEPELHRHALGVALRVVARSDTLESGVREALLAAFDPHFPTGDFSRDRLAGELLAVLSAPGIRARLLTAMEEGSAPSERIHFAHCLRGTTGGWSESDRLALEAQLARFDGVEGGHSLKGYIDRISGELRESAGSEAPIPVAQPVIALPPRVRSWTDAELIALASGPLSPEDAERGARAYEKALCHHCHRRSGQGGGIGPDLTGSAGRYTAADLVRAITAPSDAISSQYSWTEVETEDDLVLGRILRRDEHALVVNTNPFGYEPTTIPRPAIRREEESAISPMPPGLVEGLDEQEVGALLRWLLTPAGARR